MDDAAISGIRFSNLVISERLRAFSDKTEPQTRTFSLHVRTILTEKACNPRLRAGKLFCNHAPAALTPS
jgi:hypothetical protein